MQSVIVGELCMHKARFESRDHLLPQNGVMLHHGYPKTATAATAQSSKLRSRQCCAKTSQTYAQNDLLLLETVIKKSSIQVWKEKPVTKPWL